MGVSEGPPGDGRKFQGWTASAQVWELLLPPLSLYILQLCSSVLIPTHLCLCVTYWF